MEHCGDVEARQDKSRGLSPVVFMVEADADKGSDWNEEV